MCAHMCVCVYDFAAGTNEAEGDGDTGGGVGDVTKQLEQQALLEDKEKEDDGVDGNDSLTSTSSSSFTIIIHYHHSHTQTHVTRAWCHLVWCINKLHQLQERHWVL